MLNYLYLFLLLLLCTSHIHAECGDGVTSVTLGSEECDDGNLVNLDGCNSQCKFEAGFSCVFNLMTRAICSENVDAAWGRFANTVDEVDVALFGNDNDGSTCVTVGATDIWNVDLYKSTNIHAMLITTDNIPGFANFNIRVGDLNDTSANPSCGPFSLSASPALFPCKLTGRFLSISSATSFSLCDAKALSDTPSSSNWYSLLDVLGITSSMTGALVNLIDASIATCFVYTPSTPEIVNIQLDLGHQSDIYALRIYTNPIDNENIAGIEFDVYVGETSSLASALKCTPTSMKWIANGVLHQTVPCEGRRGRYITYMPVLPAASFTLCEMQVFGKACGCEWDNIKAQILGVGSDYEVLL